MGHTGAASVLPGTAVSDRIEHMLMVTGRIQSEEQCDPDLAKSSEFNLTQTDFLKFAHLLFVCCCVNFFLNFMLKPYSFH